MKSGHLRFSFDSAFGLENQDPIAKFPAYCIFAALVADNLISEVGKGATFFFAVSSKLAFGN